MATSASSPASILAIRPPVGANSTARCVPVSLSYPAASAGIAPCTASVEKMRMEAAMSAAQELEVAAVGGLHHRLAEQLVIAAQAGLRVRFHCCAPLSEFRLVHQQIEPALLYRQPHLVAGPDQRQR